MKPGSNRNEIGSFWSQATWLRSRFVLPRFEFSFMNVSSFEPYSDHFARISCVVAFQIRNTTFRNLVFMNGQSFEPCSNVATWLRF